MIDVYRLARLRATRTVGFPERDSLSHAVMVRELQRRSADYGFKEFEMPVNQLDDPQLRPTDEITRVVNEEVLPAYKAD